MIILFPTGGRTGNQLFQIAYCISISRSKEYIFTRGFGKTRSYFYGTFKQRWINVDIKWLNWIIEKVLEPFCWQVLLKTGVVSSILELHDQKIQQRRGLFYSITIVKGYFENDSFAKGRIHDAFALKYRYITPIQKIFSKIPMGSTPIFIHIRHGDFLTELIEGKSIALPNTYYDTAIEEVYKNIHNPFFFIVGDDPDYAESLFEDLKNKYVSRLSVPEDLALMSLCEGGILSNSTFAWWGAFLGMPKGYYIGPKYWSGWAVKEWRPRGMNTGLINEYLEINLGKDIKNPIQP